MKSNFMHMRILGIISFLLLVTTSCKKPDVTLDAAKNQTLTNVSYGSHSQQVMDVYLPAGRSTSTTKLLVYIHGGGWIQGDKSEFNALYPSYKAQLEDYAYVTLNYRLHDTTTEQYLFPTQEEDIVSALNYIKTKLSEWEISAKVVVCGSSAGGHLSLLHALKNNSDGLVKAAIAYFPPTEMDTLYPYSDFTTGLLEAVTGGTPSDVPDQYFQSSPANFVSSASVPVQLFHGQLDYLVPYSQSILLQNRFLSHNRPCDIHLYPNEGHGFTSNTLTESILSTKSFLETYNP